MTAPLLICHDKTNDRFDVDIGHGPHARLTIHFATLDDATGWMERFDLPFEIEGVAVCDLCGRADSHHHDMSEYGFPENPSEEEA